LKPDPGNPQEIYLKSLEAIGIDPREHDIRFVEDNWQAAGAGCLGAGLGKCGLGWDRDESPNSPIFSKRAD